MKYCFSLCFLLLCFGCDSTSHQSGFKRVSIPNPGPGHRSQKYLAFVPPDLKEPVPVLLFLHGHGEKGSDGLFQVSNNVGQNIWRRRNQFPFLTVCPQCPLNDNWDSDGPNAKHAIDCLNDAIKRFHGDPKRVFVAGISSGADGAMQLYSANPDRFAGIFLCSSGVGGARISVPDADVPTLNLVNKYDRAILQQDALDAGLKWMQAGLSPSVTIVNGSPTLPHNAWDQAYDSPITLSWLLKSVRSGSNGNTANARFELLSSEHILKTWQSNSNNNNWKPIDQYELWYEPNQDESSLRSPWLKEDCDLHFEVFLEAKSQVRFQLLSKESDAFPRFGSGIELVLELPIQGTGGVRHLTGNWIERLDPAAQHSLLEGWNEVRIQKTASNVTVHIGLWPALEADLSRKESQLQLGLLGGASGFRVRNIRMKQSPHRLPSIPKEKRPQVSR